MPKLTKPAPRAVADVETMTILASVDVAAPPERVWRALTTDEIVQWWGADDDYRTTAFRMALEPGGAWRSDGRAPSGNTFHTTGEVVEVDAPRRLVHTWLGSWPTATPTRVTYTLAPLPDAGGTRVTVRHDRFTTAHEIGHHAEGWAQALGWLAAFAGAPDARKFYVVRLIPPRPTFAADMTPDERAVMMRHVGYWRGKLAEGAAIAFGPVDDPAGGWGLGVVGAADDAELEAFQAADPAIAGGLGMRYETLPMFRLVY